jgi:hypothetical protein
MESLVEIQSDFEKEVASHSVQEVYKNIELAQKSA